MGMGTKLNGTLRAFVEKQPMFFVATAAPTGEVNMSPKGADTLRIISDTQVMWMNLSGSGNETAGHLKILPRMTLMFCAFEGDALILRLFGTARAIHPQDDGWAAAAAQFPEIAGTRQIFVMDIDRVRTSCGTGVPRMAFEASRVEVEMAPYFADLGPDGTRAFWEKKNVETIDGFPTGIFD